MKREEIYDLEKEFLTKLNLGRDVNKIYRRRRQEFSRIRSIYLFPVGIDKIHIEVILSYFSFWSQMRKGGSRWKKEEVEKGRFKYRLYLSSEENERFPLIEIHNDIRNHPITGERKRQWILRIQFNPSCWMGDLGIKGTEKSENYVAGNSKAFIRAINALKSLLLRSEFTYLEHITGVPLCVSLFRVNRVDLARDAHARPPLNRNKQVFKYSGDWEGVFWSDIVNQLVYCGPARISDFAPKLAAFWHFYGSEIHELEKELKKRKGDIALEWWVEQLKEQTVEGQNPLGSPYKYIGWRVKARHDVFYVKVRFAPAEVSIGKERLVGAPLRFEHRLLNGKEIKTVLGTATLEGVLRLLEQSDAWHREGRHDELPLLETLLNERLERLKAPSTEALEYLTRKGLPRVTAPFYAFIIELEMAHMNVNGLLADGASDKSHREMLTWIDENIKVGKRMDEATIKGVISFLHTAFLYLGPNTYYLIAGQISGYLDALGERVGGGAGRKAYDRLLGLAGFFLDFYDGDFELSNFGRRRIILDHLIVRRIDEKGFCILK